MSRDDPPDQRVICHDRFQGVYFDPSLHRGRRGRISACVGLVKVMG
jgi:hypothetical protein